MRVLTAVVSLCSLLALSSVHAQPRANGEEVVDRVGAAVLTRASGGGVGISTGSWSTMSRNSSLELQWLTVRDSSLSLVFDAPAGASGVHLDPWFRYVVRAKLHAIDPVTAFEVRVVTFDVWGEFTGTLAFTHLEDLRAGQRKEFLWNWGYLGENQLRSHHTSIAYVANVRLASGSVIRADPALVLKAAQRIQPSITLQDLTPKAEPVPVVVERISAS